MSICLLETLSKLGHEKQRH